MEAVRSNIYTDAGYSWFLWDIGTCVSNYQARHSRKPYSCYIFLVQTHFRLYWGVHILAQYYVYINIFPKCSGQAQLVHGCYFMLCTSYVCETFAILGCYTELTDSSWHFRTTCWFHLEGSCTPASQNSYNIIYLVADIMHHCIWLEHLVEKLLAGCACGNGSECGNDMWKWLNSWLRLLSKIVLTWNRNDDILLTCDRVYSFPAISFLAVISVSSNFFFPFLLWLHRVYPDFVVWLCRLNLLHAYPNFMPYFGQK
jgi:hypothetical protein